MTAIDGFADAETAALAEISIAVTYGRNGFNSHALTQTLDALDLSGFVGFVYGSGFEAQPELLAKVAATLPLIGNSADAVATIKTPTTFFAALQQLNIPYPVVADTVPEHHVNDYLFKFAGGSGGAHISLASPQHRLQADKHYFQKKIDGLSVSLLFLANRGNIEIVGFNEQWLSPAKHAPYRYGGAVSHVLLADHHKALLADAARKLTNKFGLLGINSLDALIEAESGQPLVLEINPRLSATIDLYSAEPQNLFERHVMACSSHHDFSQNKVYAFDLQCKAHAVVYAIEELELSNSVLWPDWVTDRPLFTQRTMKILATEPVCTVVAFADSAEAAKKIAQSRVEIVKSLLQSLNKKKN